MDNIFKNCKQLEAFDTTIKIFFTNLSKKIPEFDIDVKKSLKYYIKSDKSEYVKKLIKNMEPHIEFIAKCDEGIFSTDYSKTGFKLIPGLDIKKIIEFINSNIGDDENNYSYDTALKTKQSIFIYLQSLYLNAQMANSKIDDFNNIVNKQKDLLLNMFKNLNLDEKIKEKLETLEEENEEDTNSMFNKIKQLFENGTLNNIFGDLMNDFKPIFDIASDIMNELNEDKATPENISKNITDKLKIIIKSFIKKIKTKMATGEISKEIILEKIKKSLDKIKEVFPDIDFEKYFGSGFNTPEGAKETPEGENENTPEGAKETPEGAKETQEGIKENTTEEDIEDAKNNFVKMGQDLINKFTNNNEELSKMFSDITNNLGDINKNDFDDIFEDLNTE